MLIHYEGGLHMTKYREILRLTALGLSLRDIEKSLKVSRKTVVKIQRQIVKDFLIKFTKKVPEAPYGS